jgi:hypothetical protein
MLLYCYRLENLGKEFPLLKEAYNETKLLYLSIKPSWYGSINIKAAHKNNIVARSS